VIGHGVLFPDVELWACGYLRTALDDRPEAYTENVYVGNTMPATRLPLMVVVRRDGGPVGRLRDTARLTVRTWATSEQDVNDLSRMVGALLWSAPDGNPVIRVNQPTGPTPVADDSRQPLRLQSFDVEVRGQEMDAAPTPPPVGPSGLATQAVAGKPGYFLPQGAITPPTLADMADVLAVPATKWKGVEHVITGDGIHQTWSGSAWQQNPN
jgi:hypothetical protein